LLDRPTPFTTFQSDRTALSGASERKHIPSTFQAHC